MLLSGNWQPTINLYSISILSILMSSIEIYFQMRIKCSGRLFEAIKSRKSFIGNGEQKQRQERKKKNQKYNPHNNFQRTTKQTELMMMVLKKKTVADRIVNGLTILYPPKNINIERIAFA